MAAARKFFLVNMSGAATLAAAQALITAGVAACIAAGGFVPENVQTMKSVATTGDVRSDVLGLMSSKAPFQDWLAVTAAHVSLLDISGQASLAAIQALIDADGVAQALTATPQSRDVVRITLDIAGNQKDLLAILYTDGAPAVS
jgi:hypothetical protein